jgi:predicted metal-dependent hydrolase
MDIFREISPHLHAAISPRAKRLALRLDTRRRRMNLVIPKRMSLRAAYQFAYEHRNWIEEKIQTLPETIPFVNGMVLSIFDRPMTLRILKEDHFKLTKIEMNDDDIIIRTKLDDITPRLTRFLKTKAHEIFLKMCHEKAARINARIVNLSIKDMHTRWGSCSTNGMMTLSWRLIFAPAHAFDYVVAHEVAHLKHPNHGKGFWDLCEELSEDFASGHSWMKENGNILLRYG